MSDEQEPSQSAGQEQTRNETSRGERGDRSGSGVGGERSTDRSGSGGGSPDERRGGGGRHGGRRRHQQPSPQQQPSRRSDASASLNMKELRELVELFTSHGLTDFELENEDIRVRLSKNTGQIPHASSASIAPSSAPVSSSGQASPSSTASSGSESASSSTTSSATSTAAGDASRAGAEDLHIISAPIVGTFYRKPSPTSEPFVSVGSRVEAASVVCIIEAMKLMNEILAETTGVVEKIYVEDGQPVEYGQPLFGIRK